jgi:L-methionine (R)-S-oxide reductase
MSPDPETLSTLQAWLEAFLVQHGGVAGSVHALHGDQLELAAHVRLPPPVVEKTRLIPKGKGMAGLAWERGQVISTCNLKTDASGNVQPGARAVDAGAALAIPVRDPHGSLRAVLGIAFAGAREMSEAEQAQLEHAAQALPAVTRGLRSTV